MRKFERFLEEAQPKLEHTEYSQHPSKEMLTAYVYDQLDASLLSRISAHVITCQVCYEEVRRLKSELEVLEGRLASALPDPLKTCIEAEKTWRRAWAPTRWAKTFLERVLEGWGGAVPWKRRAFLGHAVAYATAAALLVVVNIILDRLLVPTPSPLASPVRVTRWWTYLYWTLLPWGLFLLGWGIRGFLLKRQERKRRDHER